MHDDIIFRASVEVCTVAILGSIAAVLLAASWWTCGKIWTTIRQRRTIYLCIPRNPDKRACFDLYRVAYWAYDAQRLCERNDLIYFPIDIKEDQS